LDNRQKPTIKATEPEVLYSKERENEFLSTYQAHLNAYCLCGYTFTMDHYLKRLIQNSHTNEIHLKYDLFFVIKGMIKCFMFNELELIFLSYFLEENKWDYLSCLTTAKCMDNFPDILKSNYEIEKPLEYKALLIYLCYSCFAIKNFFRDQNEMLLFNAFMNNTFQEFGKNYVDWRNSNQQFLLFEPLILNQIYEKNSYSWKGVQKSTEQSQNLDFMVNTILEMSPPYLYDKSIESKPNKQNFELDSPWPFDFKTGIFFILSNIIFNLTT